MREVLLLTGLLAMALLVMPTAMAKFEGQHTFIAGDNVDCAKCHSSVHAEFNSTANQVHETLDCSNCHSVDYVTDGTHAAATVECLYCHDGDARGTPGNPEWTNKSAMSITNASAVHFPFYNQTNITGVSYLKGGNEACIGCHTAITVNISWSEPSGYSFNASVDPSTQEWSLTKWGIVE